MTKENLAKIDANKVRKSSDLFALFKKYVTEDAGLIYASGKLPAGCFGCQFQTIFSKWRNVVINKNYNTKRNIMSNSKKTYILKNKATKFWFDGNVVDQNSSDLEWLRWIKYPVDTAKVEQRKQYFEKLPKDPEEVKEVVELKATEAKDEEVVKIVKPRKSKK